MIRYKRVEAMSMETGTVKMRLSHHESGLSVHGETTMDEMDPILLEEKLAKELDEKVNPPKEAKGIMQYFGYKHLPEHLQPVSRPMCELASQMNHDLPDGAEKTAGLRKLLEAKDCFVRANL